MVSYSRKKSVVLYSPLIGRAPILYFFLRFRVFYYFRALHKPLFYTQLENFPLLSVPDRSSIFFTCRGPPPRPYNSHFPFLPFVFRETYWLKLFFFFFLKGDKDADDFPFSSPLMNPDFTVVNMCCCSPYCLFEAHLPALDVSRHLFKLKCLTGKQHFGRSGPGKFLSESYPPYEVLLVMVRLLQGLPLVSAMS